MTTTKRQATALFNRYNPADAVVRSPNGRARMRKPLDIYARAAVNLYGIISREELAEIFNSQNDDETTPEEIYTLLLPNVLKSKAYAFYKDLVVHPAIFDGFDWVDYLTRHQTDKPRYLPPKDQFLKYEWHDAWDNDYWWAVREFMWQTFGAQSNTTIAFLEIQAYLRHNLNMQHVFDILDEHGLAIHASDDFQRFLSLLANATNNSRMWENKGYTPEELIAFTAAHTPHEVIPHIPQKVGRNQHCPCGSGKKYKDCCLRIEQTGWSQLTPTQCKRFYETWYKLLSFVNQKYHVTDTPIALKYPSQQDEMELNKIRDQLWDHPETITECIADGDITADEAQLMQSWQTHHIRGQFVLMEYKSAYAVLMLVSDESEPKLYAVKGMTTSIAGAMHRELPIVLDTVLLPFHKSIIYDSYMQPYSLSFGEGMKRAFDDAYIEAKAESGIITTLE